MNAIDIAIIALLVISGVFALIRGLVHEVLAVTGWVVAPIAAIWSLPYTTPLAQRFITSELFARIAAGAVVFLVVLLVLSIFTHAVARQVQKSPFGSVDRSLGFVFGLARGLVLCSLAYLVVTWLLPELPQPVKDARLLPLVQKGAALIQTVLPAHLDEIEAETRKAAGAVQNAGQAASQLGAASRAFDALKSPQPAAPAPADQHPPNYDQQGLDRLMQNSNGH